MTWIQQNDTEESEFLQRILWTDESTFTKDGVFNFHNEHEWAPENPHKTKKSSSQYKFSINISAGIVNNTLIGPHVIEGNLNSESYLNFLQETLPDLLEDVPLAVRRSIIFQHDGAPPHFGRLVKNYLDEVYPNSWIGQNGPIHWPARSPDLTPLDFYLWGTMKQYVYGVEIESRDHLITRIGEAAIHIRQQLSNMDINQGVRRRAMYCLHCDGDNFEQFLH